MHDGPPFAISVAEVQVDTTASAGAKGAKIVSSFVLSQTLSRRRVKLAVLPLAFTSFCRAIFASRSGLRTPRGMLQGATNPNASRRILSHLARRFVIESE